MEVDLLRGGKRLVPSYLLPPGDYFVHASRVDKRPKGLIWPIHLEQRLPIVSVPLREPDEKVDLDLQAVLDSVYDRSSYDLEIDYRTEPDPPLTPAQAEWMGRLLAEKKLRLSPL
jgi:hypothetical protein